MLHMPNLSDFSFFDFDGLMPHMERLSRRVEIRGGEPGVSVIENAVYVPGEQSGRTRRQRGALARGLTKPDTALIELAGELDEEVIYLGWLYDHYGHFLMRSLARAWFLSEVDRTVKVVFHHPSPARWRPAGWALQMLEAFGIPPDRMVTLATPTRLRRLIVPEPLFEPRSAADDNIVRAHEAMARPYRDVAARIAADVKPSAQPVYLSRRYLPSSQRLIIGEDELEDILRLNGFRIAHPERMPFKDQVRLVNSHTDIFSNAGSAAQNVLFALHAPRLHLLTHEHHFSPDYFMHRYLLGTPTTFINCLGTGGRPAFDWARVRMPHLLDTPRLLTYLAQKGFLTTPSGSSVKQPAERHAQYDEAWFHGYVRVVGHRMALPAVVEREALEFAAASWPVSLSLAQYYAARDVAQADGLAKQFATLAAVERNPDRLQRYRAEVEDVAPAIVRRCNAETARFVSNVVADRFLVDLKRRE
jgi:Glycosyltransferase 61